MPTIVLIIGVFILYFTHRNINTHKSREIHVPKIAEIGPFGQDVEITEKIEDLTVKFKAKRLFFQKSRIFVFKSSIIKKLVAQDIQLIVQKDGNNLLILEKKQQVLNPQLDIICIDSPKITYPSNIPPPKKVIIDKNKSKILFSYEDKIVNFYNLLK